VIRRVLGVFAYLVVATLVLGYLGVGGYRAGFVWLALALPAAATLLTWLALQGSDTTRAAWCIAAALLGLTAAAKLVDLAPDSAARIDERLGRLALPFYTPVEEHRSGHGWCRPHCPTVERVYRVPSTGAPATYFTMTLALQRAHLVDPKFALPPTLPAGRDVVLRARRLTFTLRARPSRLTVRVTARRG
jgi:hypothetical protein